MELVTNDLNADKVREETFQGREYVVAPLTLIRAMELDKGYVPEKEVQKSAPAWNGTPLTLGHPRNSNGELISANSPEVAEETWLGFVFNNQPEEDAVSGEAWFDKENVKKAGKKAVNAIQRLKAGRPLSTSSSYFFDRLPSEEYDGEYREKVSGNLRPDHVAVLVDEKGRCSIEDGCMIGGTASNAEEEFAVATYPDDSVRPESGPEEGNAATDSNDRDMSDNEAVTHFQRFLETVGVSVNVEESEEDESAESDVISNEPDMEEKTQELVENHDFNEENLPAEDTECFGMIYEAFAGNEGLEAENDDDDDDDTSGAGVSEEVDSDEDTITVTANELSQLRDDIREEARREALEAVKEQSVNEQKQALIDKITANDDSYDEDDLAETPIKVLESIRDDVSANESEGVTDFSALPGASANSGNGEKPDMPALTANERIKEMSD